MAFINKFETPGAPRALGFRLPAEWEPHEATWLAWPHETSDWPGKFHPIPWVYGEVVRKLARVERVRILVPDRDAERRVRAVLKKAAADLTHVDFHHYFTNRSWTRDYCPIFLKNAAGEVAVSDWKFNGWAKYPDYEHDNAVPEFLANQLGLRRFVADLVLEGGAIDTNGAGKLLVTEECLLSDIQARNPGKSRAELEAAFSEYLGIDDTIWLHRGIAGDDTHGHVDDLARFVNEDTVVLAVEEDPADENYEPLRENLAILRNRGDLRVVTLPMPAPLWFASQRLPASYANFYIANRTVLVPTFNDPRDRIALNTLAELFPGRQVCGIHATDLVLGLGTLHCMTMQQPAPGVAK